MSFYKQNKRHYAGGHASKYNGSGTFVNKQQRSDLTPNQSTPPFRLIHDKPFKNTDKLSASGQQFNFLLTQKRDKRGVSMMYKLCPIKWCAGKKSGIQFMLYSVEYWKGAYMVWRSFGFLKEGEFKVRIGEKNRVINIKTGRVGKLKFRT